MGSREELWAKAAAVGLCCAMAGAPASAAQNGMPGSGAAAGAQQTARGTIRGTVVDSRQAVVTGAEVVLEGAADGRHTTVTDGSGFFSLGALPPGNYSVRVVAAGFAEATAPALVLAAGQDLDLPPLVLTPATEQTIRVVPNEYELATEQVAFEEKQRVLGVVPNFYVSYVWNAAPLTPGQKFALAWRSIIDPFNIAVSAGIAGGEQAADGFPGYGQGTAGYFKRFAADYGDGVVGTLIGGAILPSLLHQDPRYFYKGTGTVSQRALYAVSTTFICKSDSGKWQPNYSNILGSFAAGGISNAYYPASNRNGASTLLANTAVGFAFSSATALLQEFVIPHFTPQFKKMKQAQP